MVYKFFFVCSCCLLAYMGGVATMGYQVFPYQLLVQAQDAFDAWWEIAIKNEMINLAYVDEKGRPEPYVQLSQPISDRDEYILMAGGPGTLPSRCPSFGCLAWVMNRQGEIVHSWEVDQGELWADSAHVGIKDHHRMAPTGLHLSKSGELIASFSSISLFPYGIGIAKFDKDGKVIWKKANFSHHWFSVAPDGRIYTPSQQLVDSPLRIGDLKGSLKCRKSQIYSDTILVLSPEGDTIETLVLFDLLIKGGYAGLMFSAYNKCDPMHLNYVEYVTAEMAQSVSSLNAGDLIFSARHLNLIAAIDGKSRALKWAIVGRTVRQHSPRMLPDGSLLVFDNYGGRRDRGGSRIVRVKVDTGMLEDVFPPADMPGNFHFFTHAAGHIDPSPDGSRLLISLTEQGRVLEIDIPHKRVLWEVMNTHDLSAYAGRSGTDTDGIARLRVNGAWYIDRPAFLGN
jgi:Arylsulfotransferase (ASST)